MARYIDADRFKRNLIIEESLLPAKKRKNLDFHSLVARVLDEMPTADVVPKSEVDRLKDDNKFLQDRRFKEWSEVRQEVAREIFEEIYKSVESKIPMGIRPIFKDYRDFDGGFINGKRDALLDVLVLVAELKKKYTEGE